MIDSSSESDDEMTFLLLCYVLRNTRRMRRSEYLKKRSTHGVFAMTRELSPESFSNYLCLNRAEFEEVLGMIGSAISSEGCNANKPVAAEEKLSVFLRYMTSGDSYKSLGYSYRLGDRTVARIVNEVSVAIWEAMQPAYLPQPTKKMWMSIASDFERLWHFPHCVGAIDGKHIMIKKPNKSGSSHSNCKHYFSIVLMAAVDAKYKFTFVDIGSMERANDGSIFSSSELKKKIATGTLELPTSDVLSSFQDPLPYVFVGNEAFPLMMNLMRPYPSKSVIGNQESKVFNDRLSRARQTVEGAFGILASRFHIFEKPFEIKVTSVVNVVKAACVLHNYLCRNADAQGDHEQIEQNFLSDHLPIGQLLPISGTRLRSVREAYEVRMKFTEYFNSVESVTWQEESVSQECC